MSEPYDSAPETRRHINHVQKLMALVSGELDERAKVHDLSKLTDPIEKSAFDRGTLALKGLTYGSQEYRDSFEKNGMKWGISRHYAANDHHPEHFAQFPDGTIDKEKLESGRAIEDMDLFQFIEMTLADWPAAVARMKDGDIEKSLEINEKRFGINPQLVAMLRNTYASMGLTQIHVFGGTAESET